jgi:hypothetical protein
VGHKDTQAHRCIGAQTQRHRDRETDIHLLTRHGPKLNEVCKEPATACLKRHAPRLFKERRKLRHLHRHTHISILPGILSLNTRMAVLRCMLSFNDYCDVRCRSMASDTSWIDTGFATVDDVKKRTTIQKGTCFQQPPHPSRIHAHKDTHTYTNTHTTGEDRVSNLIPEPRRHPPTPPTLT